MKSAGLSKVSKETRGWKTLRMISQPALCTQGRLLTVEAAVTTIDVVHGAWGRLWVATNFCVPKTGLKAALSCLARGVRQSGAAAGSLCKMLRTCEALETHAGRPSTWGTRS
jgi:hypothetical protein